MRISRRWLSPKSAPGPNALFDSCIVERFLSRVENVGLKVFLYMQTIGLEEEKTKIAKQNDFTGALIPS